MRNLIRLNDVELQQKGIPYKAGTLKWWRSKGKHPDIFVKVGGFVFLDVDKFYKKFNLKSEEATNE